MVPRTAIERLPLLKSGEAVARVFVQRRSSNENYLHVFVSFTQETIPKQHRAQTIGAFSRSPGTWCRRGRP